MVEGSQQWGRLLARLRDRRGWSQMDLARLLKRLAEQLGVRRVADAAAESIKRSVERWEAGGRPDERYWLLLTHVYARTSDGKADLGPGSDFEQLMHAFELMGVPQRHLDDLRELISAAVTTGSRAFLAHISPELQGRLSWALEHPDDWTSRRSRSFTTHSQGSDTSTKALCRSSGSCWLSRRSQRPSGNSAAVASPSVSARRSAQRRCRRSRSREACRLTFGTPTACRRTTWTPTRRAGNCATAGSRRSPCHPEA